MYTTLISVDELKALQASGAPLMIFDCSFDLMNPAAGEEQYRKAHIPGRGLCQPRHATERPGRDRPRRHASPASRRGLGRPPSAAQPREVRDVAVQRRLCQRHAGRGVRPQRRQLLRPAVVDAEVGGPRGRGRARRRPASLAGGGRRGDRSRRALALPVELRARPPSCARSPPPRTCSSRLGKRGQTLIDARATPRFKGEVEPLDPVAGHIPGALNRPFQPEHRPRRQVQAARPSSGRVRAAARPGAIPATVVHHCGSGVSACPTCLRWKWPGLGPTALYAGSWSEWCSDPSGRSRKAEAVLARRSGSARARAMRPCDARSGPRGARRADVRGSAGVASAHRAGAARVSLPPCQLVPAGCRSRPLLEVPSPCRPREPCAVEPRRVVVAGAQREQRPRRPG